MPTYDYLCGLCAHKFEEFQSITAKPLKTCPQCGKPKLKRLIGTGAGIIFKGSGFYQTDYRSESYKAAAKADNSSNSSSASASSTESKSGDSSAKSGGSDSKPAAAAPAKKTEAKASKKKD